MSDINTGGGANVGGDASAGRDLTGRDVNAGPTVHNYLGDSDDRRRHESDRAILERIDRALRGDPYNPRDRGLLHNFETVLSMQQSAKEERDALSSRVTYLSNASLVQSIVLFLVVVVLAGILIYLGQQRNLAAQPPAAAVQQPHAATVETESAKDEGGDLPVGYNADTDADNGHTVGGEQGAIGVARLRGVLPEPAPVHVPDVQVQ